MTGHQPIAKRFGDRERERLEKLCRQLGTDNPHEAEAARGRIESRRQACDKTWSDLVELLGAGTVLTIDADVAGDIIALEILISIAAPARGSASSTFSGATERPGTT